MFKLRHSLPFNFEHRRILHKKHILNILTPPEQSSSLLSIFICNFTHVRRSRSQLSRSLDRREPEPALVT